MTETSPPVRPWPATFGPGPNPIQRDAASRHRIAVLIPCRDEARTIEAVVGAFRRALPDALICVYDNGSDDATAERARAAGALVRDEPMRGKGNVVRRMFADIDAEIYVLVD